MEHRHPCRCSIAVKRSAPTGTRLFLGFSSVEARRRWMGPDADPQLEAGLSSLGRRLGAHQQDRDISYRS